MLQELLRESEGAIVEESQQILSVPWSFTPCRRGLKSSQGTPGFVP